MEGLVNLVQSMDGDSYGELIIALALAVPIIGYGAYRAFRAYRIVGDKPRSRIRSAPQGYVEVQGRFEQPDPETSREGPFSGRACIWYRARVQEKRGWGRSSRWVTVFEENDQRPCLLTDETGSCVVLPGQADRRMGLAREIFHENSLVSDPPDRLQHVSTGLFENSLRFVEERLHSTVGYVVGRFETPATGLDAEGSSGDLDDNFLSGILDNWRDDYMLEGVERPDQIKPNTITKIEDLTPRQADRLSYVAVRWAQRRRGDQDIRSVLRPTGEPRRPMIVATGREKRVLNKLFWQAYGGAAAFLIGGTVLLFMLWARFMEPGG